jgi:hypothetical protein
MYFQYCLTFKGKFGKNSTNWFLEANASQEAGYVTPYNLPKNDSSCHITSLKMGRPAI